MGRPADVDHTTRAVRGQVDVAGKTNEITAFRPLLCGLDLARTVVTADALHTQREHADWLVTAKNAAYICSVQQNQPGLYRQLKSLPWRQVPAGDDTCNAGHGRGEIHRLQVVTVGLAFPHATQAIRSTRRVRRRTGGRRRTVAVYAITSLRTYQASPAHLAGYIRGHRAIEARHHGRDTTFGEDGSQVRTGNAPRAMASRRNLTIGVLRHHSWANIAKALHHNARDTYRPLAILGISPP